MDKAKIEDFCSAPAELFQVHSLHLISPKCSAALQVTSCHLISTGMLRQTSGDFMSPYLSGILCRASGAFTAPHLLRNTLQGFRCIHCTSSLPKCSVRLQVHSLHLISSGMLCQTSGAFTAPHLYRETPSASGAMNAPEVKKCCYATKHYQCRMSYLYGFNYIL